MFPGEKPSSVFVVRAPTSICRDGGATEGKSKVVEDEWRTDSQICGFHYSCREQEADQRESLGSSNNAHKTMSNIEK